MTGRFVINTSVKFTLEYLKTACTKVMYVFLKNKWNDDYNWTSFVLIITMSTSVMSIFWELGMFVKIIFPNFHCWWSSRDRGTTLCLRSDCCNILLILRPPFCYRSSFVSCVADLSWWVRWNKFSLIVIDPYTKSCSSFSLAFILFTLFLWTDENKSGITAHRGNSIISHSRKCQNSFYPCCHGNGTNPAVPDC